MSLCNKIFLHFLSLKIFGRKLKLIINLKNMSHKNRIKIWPKKKKNQNTENLYISFHIRIKCFILMLFFV